MNNKEEVDLAQLGNGGQQRPQVGDDPGYEDNDDRDPRSLSRALATATCPIQGGKGQFRNYCC